MISNIRIGFNAIVHQNRNLDAADLDGEKVMMNLEKGKYYGLNSVGSRIWELVAEPRSIKELVEILTKEYTVDPGECEQGIRLFLQRLHEEELIFIKGEEV